jgi:hypothetical protein
VKFLTGFNLKVEVDLTDKAYDQAGKIAGKIDHLKSSAKEICKKLDINYSNFELMGAL